MEDKSGQTTPQITPKPRRLFQLRVDMANQTSPQQSFTDAEEEQSLRTVSRSDLSDYTVYSSVVMPLRVPPDLRDVTDSYERRKKRLHYSLKECCCCVDLRVGCCFMALFELWSSSMCLVFGESNWMLYIGRLGYLAYLIGSAMLAAGTYFERQFLVRIYLFTNVVHLLLCPLFIVQHAQRTCVDCFYEILGLSFLLILSVYFGLVAYSYLVLLQWQQSRFYMPFGRMARGDIRRCRREDIEGVQPAVESQEQEQRHQQSQVQSHVDLFETSNEQQSVL